MIRTLMLAATAAFISASCSDDGGSTPPDAAPDTTQTADATADAPTPDLPANLTELSNAAHPTPGCAAGDGALAQDPSESPAYVVARLTPPSYPFTVVQVSYLLWSKDNNSSIKTCDARIPHKVMVWSGNTTTPEASPTAAFTKDVERWDTALTTASRRVKLWLPKPITLQSGEHLFVSVLVQRDPDDASLTMCLQGCFGENLSERTFATEALTPPYTWEDLGPNGDFTVTTSALGYEG